MIKRGFKSTAMILSAALMLSAVGCGSKEAETTAATEAVTEAATTEADTETASETDTEAATEAETEEATEAASTAKFENASYEIDGWGGGKTVDIVGADFVEIKEEDKEDYDCDVLRIWYEMTNTLDEPYNLRGIYWHCYQNGEEVEDPGLSLDYDEWDIYEMQRYQMIPGARLRHYKDFAVHKDQGPIKLVISGDDKEEQNVVEIDPNGEFPGRPAEDFVITKIEDPSYGGKLDISEADMRDGQYHVTYKSHEYTSKTDYVDGDTIETPCLRIFWTFTNNSDKENSMFMAVNSNCTVYQDGIELQETRPTDWGDIDSAQSEDIQPGESIDCCFNYALRSDSPVEIVYEEMFNGVLIDFVIDDIPAK
ncbi:MAG: DUF5067 domain-containing protein [Eubacterium sp.]|nr:DUF5067 domain-containing protein [Eubacterium sp.]